MGGRIILKSMGFEVFAATSLNIRFSGMPPCVSAYRIPTFRSNLVSLCSITEILDIFSLQS